MVECESDIIASRLLRPVLCQFAGLDFTLGLHFLIRSLNPSSEAMDMYVIILFENKMAVYPLMI